MIKLCLRFAWITLVHKYWVWKIGRRIGGIPAWQLLVHDWTKFSPSEIWGFAQWFYGDRDSRDAEAHTLAWLHHQNYNPHHWEYWLGRSGERAPHKIPERFLREMLADWMAVERTYKWAKRTREWYRDMQYHIKMHPESKVRIEQLMEEYL